MAHEESAPKGSLVMRDLNDRRAGRSSTVLVELEMEVDGFKRRAVVVVVTRARSRSCHGLVSMVSAVSSIASF